MTKKTKPVHNPHTASFGNEGRTVDCPNCETPMELVAYGRYIHHEGKLSDYEKWECRNCGYVLHSYRPPEASADDASFPF